MQEKTKERIGFFAVVGLLLVTMSIVLSIHVAKDGRLENELQRECVKACHGCGGARLEYRQDSMTCTCDPNLEAQ